MKLVALRCPQCDEWLQPRQDVVAMPCPQCATAVSLTDQGVKAMDLQYGQQLEGAALRHPFWAFQGKVHIKVRRTQGGRRNDSKAAQQFWAVPRRFFVPAWELPVAKARALGGHLVQQQPEYINEEEPKEASFITATITAVDARKLLDFIILSLEAGRKDWLQEFEFELEVGPPTLWALPARETTRGWRVFAVKTGDE